MIYRFGPFEYDAEQRLLFRSGETVQLVPKALDTLHVLIERRGRVVEKAELMKLVWPDTVVEEVGLARNISILRKALTDDGAESSYVETIPRRGYRFQAEEAPEPVPAAPSRRRWIVPASIAAALALTSLAYWQFYVPSRFVSRVPPLAALAVVPFEPLGDLKYSGIAEGMTDALVAGLSKIDGLQVTSPSTVRRHQRVGNSMGLMGRLLGLDVLVEGSVQRSGERLRVTVRLVDVHTGKVIWSDANDRPATDPGELESQVAAQAAAQVAAHLAIHGEFGVKPAQ